MYRKHRAFLSGLEMVILAAVAPSSGWAQDRLAAGEPVTLTPPGASTVLNIDSIAWSPDGTKIAFSTNHGGEEWQRRISLINTDGTNLVHQLPNRDIHEIAGPLWPPTDIRYRNHVVWSSSVSYISWSPDGTRIAFFRVDTVGVPGRQRSGFGPRLSVMNVSGSNIVGLPNAPPPIWLGGTQLSWLPDGRIAYLGKSRSGTPGFYAGNVDGTNFVRLADLSHLPIPTDDDDYGPTFLYSASLSPDGTRIAYGMRSGWGFEDGDEIFVMNIDGTNLFRVRGSGFADSDSIAWSPDGTKIAYSSRRFALRGNDAINFYVSDIEVANVDGATPPVNLTEESIITFPNGIYSYQGPKWSSDGTKIAARYSPDYNSNLYRIRIIPLTDGPPTERGDRRATLLNLSPWQAWVHLYCLKDRAGPDADPPAPCAVTFECNGFSGEPVAWPVEVAPKTIFTYWPNKTVDGTSANLQAALMAAGKPVEEARRRTTCEVFSPDPLTVRGYTLFGDPTLVPVAEPARPAVSGEPGERRRQATLPNLSPWQAWVHLYCLKDQAGPDADPPAPCAVTFECNGQSGEPVTWPVEVAPKTIFTYWPNKMVDGMSANLQAALMAAGKTVEEARRRTTCEVSSPDPIAVRGYTRFNGQPPLVPVPAYPLFR